MKARPRLLDLFCGAGGCAVGYERAGFEVVGVDIKPQPRYPFSFCQGDVFDFLSMDELRFDAIHASPPCQSYSRLAHFTDGSHLRLVEIVRRILLKIGKPFVIENVPGAPLLKPAMLCGSYFGLGVRRHRLFESTFALRGTYCTHKKQGTPICVAGTGGRRVNRRKGDHGGAVNFPRNVAHAREVMGIDWMTRDELSQAIPPAYTEYIGKQLLRAIQ